MITRILIGSLILLFVLSDTTSASEGGGKKKAKNGMAVVVAFPEKNIPLPTDPTIWNHMARLLDFDGDGHWRVGHAGLLLIDKLNGETEYVDFGRYDDREDLPGPRPENYGVVRSPETIPEFKLQLRARFEDGILANLDSLLIMLAANPGFKDYGRIEAAVYDRLQLDKMKDFVSELSREGYIPYGCPTRQYCTRFARQVIRKGGGRYSIGVYTGQQMVHWNRKKL